MTRLLLAALLVAGCRTARVADGASTSMTVPQGTRVAVADLLTRAMLNRGFQVREVGPKSARFARAGEAGVELNARFELSDVKGGAHIAATLDSGDDLGKVQEILGAIRDRIARQTPPPAAAPPEEDKPAPKAERKVRRAEPSGEAKPKTASGGGEDDLLQQMQKRALGNK